MTESNKPLSQQEEGDQKEQIEELSFDGIGEIPDELWDQIRGQISKQIKAGRKSEDPSKGSPNTQK